MTSTPTPVPEPLRADGSCVNCGKTGGHTFTCWWARRYSTGPAPSTPGEGDGRPGAWVPNIGHIAQISDLADDDCAEATDSDGNTEASGTAWALLDDGLWPNAPVIVTRWADGTTPAPPASPVPPTPTPCPYIVTGGEGTSYCSLPERSALHAAAPPSTTAAPRPTDPTGSEA